MASNEMIVRVREQADGGARRVQTAVRVAIRSRRPRAAPSLISQNAEVLTLTYGALVRQLVADLDDVDAVNRQLDQM